MNHKFKEVKWASRRNRVIKNFLRLILALAINVSFKRREQEYK